MFNTTKLNNKLKKNVLPQKTGCPKADKITRNQFLRSGLFKVSGEVVAI